MAAKSGRTISSSKPFSVKELFLRWEMLLVLVFLGVNVMNSSISPYYLNTRNLFTNINNFMDTAMIALPMAFILLLGDVDLSVGGNVCLPPCWVSFTMPRVTFGWAFSQVSQQVLSAVH